MMASSEEVVILFDIDFDGCNANKYLSSNYSVKYFLLPLFLNVNLHLKYESRGQSVWCRNVGRKIKNIFGLPLTREIVLVYVYFFYC